MKTKILVTCCKHGDFYVVPKVHCNTKSGGCRLCEIALKIRIDCNIFKIKAKEIHGDKYNYDKTNYIDAKSKVVITCPIHGEFLQTPDKHLSGQHCRQCTGNFKKTTGIFIDKAKEVHGNKYSYDKTNYINAKSKVVITCPIHGDFSQAARAHLTKQGCPNCNESKGEQSVVNILNKNNYHFKRQFRYNDCRYKNPLPFDFLVKINDDCEFLIEYNGKQHYEPIFRSGNCDIGVMQNRLQEIQRNDRIKILWCSENNIPLLTIHYLDKFIEDTIKNFIQNLKQ